MQMFLDGHSCKRELRETPSLRGRTNGIPVCLMPFFLGLSCALRDALIEGIGLLKWADLLNLHCLFIFYQKSSSCELHELNDMGLAVSQRNLGWTPRLHD